MEKVIRPSSWDFGESITQLVKYSSKGLVGHDYGVPSAMRSRASTCSARCRSCTTTSD